MINLRKIFLLVTFGCLLSNVPLFACRYNVRDIGFVDFQTSPYLFYAFVTNDTSSQVTDTLTNTSHAILADSNIRTIIINKDTQSTHPALEYISSLKIDSFPFGVLVSPEVQPLPIPLLKPAAQFETSLYDSLNALIKSPTRDKILQNIRAFAIVLLIETDDTPQNTLAKTAAQNAIKKIIDQMELMPKKVENPPTLITLSPDMLSEEKVLLWALGLNPDSLTQPAAAVLYGRARRMGPVLAGPDITEQRLKNFLSIIGADCECGLDRRWMQGTMLPLVWEQQTRDLIAENLQFDPENPMVKMEIDRILRFGPGAQSDFQNPDSYPDLSFGYREIVVQFPNPNQPAPALSDDQNQTEPLSHPEAVEKPPQPDSEQIPLAQTDSQELIPRKKLYFIVAITCAGLIILTGLAIVFRSRFKD